MYFGVQKAGINQLASLMLATSLLISGIVIEPAQAQDDPVYLSEYKAYLQAIEAGDSEAAERHGYTAWQVAEEALGDNQLTGILAFNYGQLVIFTNTESALAALKRAKALHDAGFVELPSDDLNLFLAYAEFSPNRQWRRQANTLRSALIAIEKAGITTSDTATMWLYLAASDYQSKRYKDAVESAGKAERAFEISSPENYRQKANAIVIAGASKVIPLPRKIEDVVSAHGDFERAIRLYPPQKDFESFDPILAQALGWFAAADAAIGTLGENHGEVLDGVGGPMPPVFEVDADAPQDCGIEWEKRPPPKYSNLANYRGYFGAVMVIYELGDDVNIHNPRILSEVPVNTFSKDVLRSMRGWKLKSPPVNHPGCRKNLMTQFTFVLVDR